MKFPRLTRTVLPPFIAINLLIIFMYSYALAFVLPQNPFIHPVALALFLLSETALYFTLSPVSLERYQTALSSHHNSHQLCKKCSHPRPPRTHHCSRCDCCIPRMSHHCSVLCICIGAHNFKPFLLLLFYAFISGAISFFLSMPDAVALVKHLYVQRNSITVFHLLRAQAMYAQFAVAISMLAIFLYHFYFIATGWTIFEAITLHPAPRIFPPWSRSRSVFDKGFTRNLAQVFGTGYSVLLPNVDPHGLISITDDNIPDI